MKNIRIEKVGDINSDYPYLEVFVGDSSNPFLEISITDKNELYFKYYASSFTVVLNLEEWSCILTKAQEFLPMALKDEDNFFSSTREDIL